MNRFVLAAVLTGLAAAAVPAGAQEQSYTAASPAPLGYSDPAMSFRPPADFKQAGPMLKFDPNEFGQPTVAAAFVKNPGKADMHLIQITIEDFEGSLDGFETESANILRGQVDGVFISNKQRTTLSNGMPAIWEQISIGDGFNETKRWQYMWVDGVRGIILSITGKYGYIDEAQAKQELANASGVAFPRYRE